MLKPWPTKPSGAVPYPTFGQGYSKKVGCVVGRVGQLDQDLGGWKQRWESCKADGVLVTVLEACLAWCVSKTRQSELDVTYVSRRSAGVAGALRYREG
jgi:hypothetical protein